mmetsp:Transcript_40008/g.91252  ORF Transcript_40008/g.91252 Transcript_40008/m.91252 type:complete len:228 (-) Transcript_40008:523-1206(-)
MDAMGVSSTGVASTERSTSPGRKTPSAAAGDIRRHSSTTAPHSAEPSPLIFESGRASSTSPMPPHRSPGWKFGLTIGATAPSEPDFFASPLPPTLGAGRHDLTSSMLCCFGAAFSSADAPPISGIASESESESTSGGGSNSSSPSTGPGSEETSSEDPPRTIGGSWSDSVRELERSAPGISPASHISNPYLSRQASRMPRAASSSRSKVGSRMYRFGSCSMSLRIAS